MRVFGWTKLLLLVLVVDVGASNTLAACIQSSALTLGNFMGRSFQIRSCFESGFVNNDLIDLYDATMNSSVASLLRSIYTSCVKSYEMPNYFLGYMANWNADGNDTYPYGQWRGNGPQGFEIPRPVNGLVLGVGNTISSAYLLSRPFERALTYYSSSLQVSSVISLPAGGFDMGKRPWFLNFWMFDEEWEIPGWYTFYPDASIKGQNDSTICFPAATEASVHKLWKNDNGVPDPLLQDPANPKGSAGALVCLDFRIPVMPNCGGWSFVLRNWGADANYIYTFDQTDESLFNGDIHAQLMTITPGTPDGVIQALMDELWIRDQDGLPRWFPTEHFTRDLLVKEHPSLERDARLYFADAGTHGGYLTRQRTVRWYVLIVRYV